MNTAMATELCNTCKANQNIQYLVNANATYLFLHPDQEPIFLPLPTFDKAWFEKKLEEGTFINSNNSVETNVAFILKRLFNLSAVVKLVDHLTDKEVYAQGPSNKGLDHNVFKLHTVEKVSCRESYLKLNFERDEIYSFVIGYSIFSGPKAFNAKDIPPINADGYLLITVSNKLGSKKFFTSEDLFNPDISLEFMTTCHFSAPEHNQSDIWSQDVALAKLTGAELDKLLTKCLKKTITDFYK